MKLYDMWSVREPGDIFALVCSVPQEEKPKGSIIKYLGTTVDPKNFWPAKNEAQKRYEDNHPYRCGSLERHLWDKFGSPDRTASIHRIKYWANRTLEELHKEYGRRHPDREVVKNRSEILYAFYNYWSCGL